MASPRREIKSRDTKWAKALSTFIATKTNITPNAISVLSVFWAFFAMCAYCLYLHPLAVSQFYFIIPILIIVGIQMRLICNLIDGMVAVEGGKHSVVGGIYNEFPDRISDTCILIGAGIAGLTNLSIFLGLTASLLAVLTAYTRLLGGTVGANQYFIGPMAKQHRMALLTVVAVICLFQPLVPYINVIVYPITLIIICIGCIITVWRRLNHIKNELESKEV